MKFRVVYTFLLLLFILFIFQSNSGGRAASGDGSTMAPGDGIFCSTCHFGGNYDPEINMTLLDPVLEEAVTEYVPGKTYKVIINISASNNPGGYGFQALVLKDADNTAVNNWVTAITQNTNFRTISNGRQYFEQNRRLATNEFEAEWTAPEESTGDITFYLAGNAVNGNGNTSGDSPAANSVTFPEKVVTSAAFPDAEISMDFSPNPVFNDLWIRFNTRVSKTYTVHILDMNGREWINKEITSWPGESVGKIELTTLPSGRYIIAVTDGAGALTKRIIKL